MNIFNRVSNNFAYSSTDYSEELNDAIMYWMMVGWGPDRGLLKDDPDYIDARLGIITRFNLTSKDVEALEKLRVVISKMKLEDK